MNDAERINALVEALVSMQKRCPDSETKVEMLQEQLAHSNKRMGDLKEQLQTEKLSQKEEDWHNKTVIEGLKKTLKKKEEELNKTEEKYNEANRIAMEWEEKFYALRDQQSYDIYSMLDEIKYLQELVNEYKEAAEFKDEEIRNCNKLLEEVKFWGSSYESQVKRYEHKVESLEMENQALQKEIQCWTEKVGEF